MILAPNQTPDRESLLRFIVLDCATKELICSTSTSDEAYAATLIFSALLAETDSPFVPTAAIDTKSMTRVDLDAIPTREIVSLLSDALEAIGGEMTDIQKCLLHAKLILIFESEGIHHDGIVRHDWEVNNKTVLSDSPDTTN